MKKTKVVKIPAKKAVSARTKEVTETVCDFCGANLPNHGSYGLYPTCSLCGRDCCYKHNKPESNYDDYTEWFCIVCYALKFGEYAKFYEEISIYHEKEIERLNYQLKMESLSK